MENGVRLTDHETLESLFGELEKIDNPMLDMPGTMGRYLDMKARQRGIPMHGTFEITPLCNLDCKMCYVHLNKGQMQGRELLTVEQWKSLMNQAVEAGMMDAVLTGGECLTYPGFDELYLHLQSMGIRTTILTNGLLLTEERIAFFEKYPPKGIQITLYGSSEEEYEAVTGHRCFERVLRNIRNAAKTKIPLSIAITPNRFLLDGGENLVKLAHSLGLWYTINTSLFKPREETGRRDDNIDLEAEDYIRLHILRRNLNGQHIAPPAECELPRPAKSGKPVKGLLCAGGNSTFDIGWDGTMKPCSNFYDAEAYPLRDGFLAAWKQVREASLNYPLPEECGDCPYNVLCPACVMVHRQNAPKGHASPRICDRAKRIASSGLVDLNLK